MAETTIVRADVLRGPETSPTTPQSRDASTISHVNLSRAIQASRSLTEDQVNVNYNIRQLANFDAVHNITQAQITEKGPLDIRESNEPDESKRPKSIKIENPNRRGSLADWTISHIVGVETVTDNDGNPRVVYHCRIERPNDRAEVVALNQNFVVNRFLTENLDAIAENMPGENSKKLLKLTVEANEKGAQVFTDMGAEADTLIVESAKESGFLTKADMRAWVDAAYNAKGLDLPPPSGPLKIMLEEGIVQSELQLVKMRPDELAILVSRHNAQEPDASKHITITTADIALAQADAQERHEHLQARKQTDEGKVEAKKQQTHQALTEVIDNAEGNIIDSVTLSRLVTTASVDATQLDKALEKAKENKKALDKYLEQPQSRDNVDDYRILRARQQRLALEIAAYEEAQIQATRDNDGTPINGEVIPVLRDYELAMASGKIPLQEARAIAQAFRNGDAAQVIETLFNRLNAHVNEEYSQIMPALDTAYKHEAYRYLATKWSKQGLLMGLGIAALAFNRAKNEALGQVAGAPPRMPGH